LAAHPSWTRQVKSLRVLAICGTRPEVVKMAPVIQELKGRKTQVECLVCVTAQHREMLDQVLRVFSLCPDFDFNLMEQGQTLSQIAARVMTEVENLLARLKPHWVMVQGDTTTVMAASIAAHHSGVRVAHVEAGLRTFDRANPFPEEMNRIITDHVSDLHFAPTRLAKQNLLREGIRKESVFITGNSVVDALEWVLRQQGPTSSDYVTVFPDYRRGNHGASKVLPRKRLILVTAHRRENFGPQVLSICHAIRQIAARGDVDLVFPVHRNPNIWQPVHEALDDVDGVTLLPPIDYVSLVGLMSRSCLILTDSGGIQEEAPSLGVPVLVMRHTTERQEALDAGVARLVGTEAARIISEVNLLLDDPQAYAKMTRQDNPFGDGHAARRIVDALLTGSCDEFCSGTGHSESRWA